MNKYRYIKARHTLKVNAAKVGNDFQPGSSRPPPPDRCRNGHQVTKLCVNVCPCGEEVR